MVVDGGGTVLRHGDGLIIVHRRAVVGPESPVNLVKVRNEREVEEITNR